MCEAGLARARDCVPPPSPPASQTAVVAAVWPESYRGERPVDVPLYGNYAMDFPGFNFIEAEYEKHPESREDETTVSVGETQEMRGGDVHKVKFNILDKIKRAAWVAGSGALFLLILSF